MITLKLIKETVERISGVNDISVKKKTNYLVHCRFCYFKLCQVFRKELKNPSLYVIGAKVKRDHATVLHGLKTFDNLMETKGLITEDVYSACLKLLGGYLDNSDELKEAIKNKDLNNYYKIRHIKLQEKYRSVINNLSYKLSMYRGNPIVDNIITLEKQDLKELEIKLDAFFKVKKAINP